MNSRELLILNLLAESDHKVFGLDLIAASNGNLHRGTIYVWLQRLEEADLVESEWQAETDTPAGWTSGILRRLYWITDRGRLAIEEAKPLLQRP